MKTAWLATFVDNNDGGACVNNNDCPGKMTLEDIGCCREGLETDTCGLCGGENFYENCNPANYDPDKCTRMDCWGTCKGSAEFVVREDPGSTSEQDLGPRSGQLAGDVGLLPAVGDVRREGRGGGVVMRVVVTRPVASPLPSAASSRVRIGRPSVACEMTWLGTF